jgi:hypothetical protein
MTDIYYDTDSHAAQCTAYPQGVELRIRTMRKLDGSYDLYVSAAGQGWKLVAVNAFPENEED